MEVKALLSEEFSPNRWILVNLAHAIRNLVHYIVQTEFLWIWHKLALSCGGWGGPYLTFLLWSAQSHFFPSSASNSSCWNQNFLDFYLSCLLPQDSSEFHIFSSWENQIDFLPASFPLSRPMAQTLDVFTRAAAKHMFYKTRVLPMMLQPLFCSYSWVNENWAFLAENYVIL